MAQEYHGHYQECTASTTGKIIKRHHGSGATSATAEYFVDGKKYEIEEVLIVKSRPIKLGFLPIGQITEPVIGPVSDGSEVEISYNPDKPWIAFMTGNKGFRTM